MTIFTPDQIRPGCSYLLIPRYVQHPGVTRRVERIEDGQVVVIVNDKEVRMPVRDFSRMAVEEVEV